MGKYDFLAADYDNREKQNAAQGHSYISPEMTACLLKQSYHRDTQPGMEQQRAMLTPAELRILQMVGAYKTTREMADELSIGEKTVSNHRMNIARKLSLTGKNSCFASPSPPCRRIGSSTYIIER